MEVDDATPFSHSIVGSRSAFLRNCASPDGQTRTFSRKRLGKPCASARVL